MIECGLGKGEHEFFKTGVGSLWLFSQLACLLNPTRVKASDGETNEEKFGSAFVSDAAMDRVSWGLLWKDGGDHGLEVLAVFDNITLKKGFGKAIGVVGNVQPTTEFVEGLWVGLGLCRIKCREVKIEMGLVEAVNGKRLVAEEFGKVTAKF